MIYFDLCQVHCTQFQLQDMSDAGRARIYHVLFSFLIDNETIVEVSSIADEQ